MRSLPWIDLTRLVLVVALLVLCPGCPVSLAVAPPTSIDSTPLTGQQSKQLDERDRLAEQMEKPGRENKLTESIAVAEKMLAIERALFGNDHLEVAGSLQLLGRLHEARGAFARAHRALAEVAAIMTRLYGPQHWRTIDSRLDLADLDLRARLSAEQHRLTEARQLDERVGRLQRQRRFRQALPAAQQSLAIRKELLGENHRSVVGSLNLLANLHYSLREFKEAEPLYRQALAKGKGVLGQEHPLYATWLNNLANTCAALGDVAQAEPRYRKALALRSKVLGERHPDSIHTLKDMVGTYETLMRKRGAQRNPQELRGILGKLLPIKKQLLGETHWQVVDIRLQLKELDRLATLTPEQHRLLQQAMNQSGLASRYQGKAITRKPSRATARPSPS
jgi:tetratricopeptide (TPR) repeat protein